jgi:hypothetical protein
MLVRRPTQVPPSYGYEDGHVVAGIRINEKHSSQAKRKDKMIFNFTASETRAFRSVKI